MINPHYWSKQIKSQNHADIRIYQSTQWYKLTTDFGTLPQWSYTLFDAKLRFYPSHFFHTRASKWNYNQRSLKLIAVFNNMRTLKFKAQLTIGFFAAVNHNYGDSQRTLKHKNKQNGSKSTNHDCKTYVSQEVRLDDWR